MAEAMALGKAVIATGYSGNLDFMNEDTAYLVPWTYTEVPPGCDPYPVGAKWAEPDLVEAARLMRHVVDHPDEAAAMGAAARAWVLTAHAPSVRADFIRGRLAQIEADRTAFLVRAARADAPPYVGPTRRVRVPGAAVGKGDTVSAPDRAPAARLRRSRLRGPRPRVGELCRSRWGRHAPADGGAVRSQAYVGTPAVTEPAPALPPTRRGTRLRAGSVPV